MLHSSRQSFQDALLCVVEIGNTNTSFAVFSGDECLEVRKVPSVILNGYEDVASQIAPILEKYPVLRDAALCSVVPSVSSVVFSFLRHHLAGQVLEVSSSIKLPFILRYESPDSFGADRIALCAQSSLLYPEEPVIALDIGTAITVDVLGSDRAYLGGLIMSGLDLMAKALSEHTARLPLVRMDLPDTLIGFSTSECIRNGIIWGCVSGLEGLLVKIKTLLIEEYKAKNIRVLATGGNAPLIAGMLACSPVLDKLAVLRGTRHLFTLNASASR
ncbi:MAG: type III pantothenate kinase [Chlorobiales bacterium]|nr:type III pantothenate kinase [Chlorobiales bacterium]